MVAPSFDQFSAFVREFSQIPRKTAITTSTRFEKDLGITGDDGTDLLEATEKRFGVELGSEAHGKRPSFNLGVDEYLFHGEGFDLFGFVRRLRGNGRTVREFTVGELYNAVCQACGREHESAI
jgi:hypothetical protein